MKLKRGVLFPENQKEEPIIISEQEIKKSKTKSLSVFFSNMFLDVDRQKMWKYIGYFIVALLLFIFLILVINDFKKGQEEQAKEKATLVQEEINDCYGMLNALKTFKATRKKKEIIKSRIIIKLDSLIVVRENLKAE
ncbi:hypothetical protein [Flavobacterium sp. TAB 87]|uniref:hypothetical protein n=1 Tax=Flavobacterium sp. TAB 87 TaxID=1729581 RepID=UPI00076DB22A|nr:hypothetical protein [Flavobacterium sp. TAB 87]KVV13409.1 hypothetical protein AP058_02772 [Flavobacterium sp. TAB 87]